MNTARHLIAAGSRVVVVIGVYQSKCIYAESVAEAILNVSMFNSEGLYILHLVVENQSGCDLPWQSISPTGPTTEAQRF